ncbi:Phosphoribosylformylglycinamidine cyclo-ligase [subsurface metagenome]
MNDLIAGGAKPLFFLDYFSCGKLNEEVFGRVMKGIGRGLKKADCVLIGGETAEMPDMYKAGDYDLAGFACGIIIKEFKKENVKKGDWIIGLKSNGIHSNGFSLVRKIFSKIELKKYKDLILKQTKIYSIFVNSYARKRLYTSSIKSMAHVTGGGIDRAIKRLLPGGMKGEIFPYALPEIFDIIERKDIKRKEMNKIFNMGWGMLLVVEEKHKRKILKEFGGSVIGRVI